MDGRFCRFTDFAILEPRLVLPFLASSHTGFTRLPFSEVINVRMNHCINHGAQSICQSVNQRVNKPMNESTKQSMRKPTSHSTNQPIHQIDESAGQCINKRPTSAREVFAQEPLPARWEKADSFVDSRANLLADWRSG